MRPDSPEPEPVKAPMGKWAKKPEIKDTILKDDFVLPKAYRKEEPKRARKKKYRNINEHSDVILLPGRHMCDCQVSFYQTTEFIFFSMQIQAFFVILELVLLSMIHKTIFLHREVVRRELLN